MRVDKFLPDMIQELKPITLKELDGLCRELMLNFRRLGAEGVNQAELFDHKDIKKHHRKVEMYWLKTVMKINTYKGLNTTFTEQFLQAIHHNNMTDPPTMNMALNLLQFRKTAGKRYVFNSSFWNELKNTNLSEIKLTDLIQGSGVIKLPVPLIDELGDSFNEFVFFVGPVKDFYLCESDEDWALFRKASEEEELTDKSLQFTITWKDNKGLTNYASACANNPDSTLKELFKGVEFVVTDPVRSQVIEQEDGYKPHIRAIFNCLVYLKSGQPDLRETKNDIKYKGQSFSPVRKDKDLSKEKFISVGFGFKKTPNYSKEFFYQPNYYARRGLEKKWTWCKGSLKRRKVNTTQQLERTNK